MVIGVKMPGKGQYKLVFEGRILEGQNLAEVKKRFAGLLKSDIKKIDRLFVGAPVILKKNIDYPTASKFKEALRAAGVVCEIKRIDNADVAVTPPPLISADRPPGEGSIQTESTDAATVIPAARIRPRRIWYVIAATLFIVPPIIAGIKMSVAIFSYIVSGIELTAPGVTEVIIEKPGKFIIWYPTGDGQSYRRDIPQDIKTAVYGHEAERYLEVRAPSWYTTETTAGVERQSIAEVYIDRAGIYTIEVNGDFPETDLMLRRSLGSGLLINFIIPTGLCLTGFIVGLTMAIVVFVKRSNLKARFRPQALSQKEERQWAMFSHLGTFCAFFLPFGNIIVPLAIWQVKKGESSFVVQHSKESLNFQFSLMIYYFAATLLVLIIIGFLLLAGLFIFNIIIVIIAGIKANEGENYRYPMTIRFFKY
jgi:uncharacterized Tic20 family protein